MIRLEKSSKGDEIVKYLMSIHYSKPKGFVGRQLVYKIYDDNLIMGVIVGGSATMHLPNRNEFFGDKFYLNGIVNNIFYHIMTEDELQAIGVNSDTYIKDKNLGTKTLKLFRNQVVTDWEEKYKDKVIGFETLIELPRSGSLYKADNWTYVGTTKGFTCKRVAGEQTENWTGKRVWNKNPDELKPKLVFCKLI